MSTRIAVIDPDRERALLIVDGLKEAGENDIHVIGDDTGVARRLAEINPDIVLIDLENPSRDVMEQVAHASGAMERPVAMFVDRSDEGMIRSAIEAGGSAYVVDGLRKERIKPVLEAAIARFHSIARLRAALDATKAALAERKILDRAKGILMKAKGLSEEEAYGALRRAAMDQNRKISEIAQSIVTAAELLK
ncbi:MAG: ANTAR domain-containing response regulator [Neomegalonema sp.]